MCSSYSQTINGGLTPYRRLAFEVVSERRQLSDRCQVTPDKLAKHNAVLYTSCVCTNDRNQLLFAFKRSVRSSNNRQFTLYVGGSMLIVSFTKCMYRKCKSVSVYCTTLHVRNFNVIIIKCLLQCSINLSSSTQGQAGAITQIHVQIRSCVMSN